MPGIVYRRFVVVDITNDVLLSLKSVLHTCCPDLELLNRISGSVSDSNPATKQARRQRVESFAMTTVKG